MSKNSSRGRGPAMPQAQQDAAAETPRSETPRSEILGAQDLETRGSEDLDAEDLGSEDMDEQDSGELLGEPDHDELARLVGEGGLEPPLTGEADMKPPLGDEEDTAKDTLHAGERYRIVSQHPGMAHILPPHETRVEFAEDEAGEWVSGEVDADTAEALADVPGYEVRTLGNSQ